MTAALQELNVRIRPTNEHFAQWFAGIGYKEINPARLERFFSVLVWRIPAAQNALQQRVATSLSTAGIARLSLAAFALVVWASFG